jgi:hypothetical protein
MGSNSVRPILRMVISLGFIVGTPAVYQRSLTAQESIHRQGFAKAQALLQDVVIALGGQAFQDVRDSDCSGQIAEFGHNGEILIYAPFREMWILPDKNRSEYSSRDQTVITVLNGNRGWRLDKTGVSDQPDDAIEKFAEQMRFGMYNTLRLHRSEEGVEFFYVGRDSIDSKAVEWIESSEYKNRELRLAIEESTRLPVQWVVSSRDPETGGSVGDTTSYEEFVLNDGVQTPLRVSHSQNGRLVSQIFVTSCKYNSNLPPQLFTRTSLEQRKKEASKDAQK